MYKALLANNNTKQILVINYSNSFDLFISTNGLYGIFLHDCCDDFFHIIVPWISLNKYSITPGAILL